MQKLTMALAMQLTEANPMFWQQLAEQIGTSKAEAKRLVTQGAVSMTRDELKESIEGIISHGERKNIPWAEQAEAILELFDRAVAHNIPIDVSKDRSNGANESQTTGRAWT